METTAVDESTVEKFITNSLRTLGKSPNKIATNLIERGIKAKTIRPDSCAITLFVLEELASLTNYGEKFKVITEIQSTIIRKSDDNWCAVVSHTDAIKKFIERFDNGEYPLLDKDVTILEERPY